MNRKFFAIGLVLLVALSALFSTVYASSITSTISLTCTEVNVSAGTVTYDRDNTGMGEEAARIDVIDGAGTVLYTQSANVPLGSYPSMAGAIPYSVAPQYNPITFTLTSLAGNGLPEEVISIQQGSCAGLPTFGASAPAASSSNVCGLTLPSGAVIGDMPFSTQAYWAPGKASSGLMINAGTYHVLGVDETGDWYKIMLGCGFLWVPVESMQPSYQAPQNGAPLPTGVVS